MSLLTVRIAHVLPANIPVTTEFGGALERRCLAMSDRQAREGHEVLVFSANEPTSHLRGSGVWIQRVPVVSKRPYRDVEYLLTVKRQLFGREVDVLHSHAQIASAGILDGQAKATLGQFDFYEARGSRNPMGRRVYARLLAKFDTLSCVSNFTAVNMAQYYGLSEVPALLPNGVDLCHFHSNAKVSQAFLNDNPELGDRYVLFVGRINEQKGADMLPSIADALAGVDVRLIAAGPLGQFGRLTGEKNPLDGTLVTYLGAVPDAELPGLMAGADALVLPTRQHEMFGMVIVEAGACGTPAVAAALGGIPEAMGSGGVLAAPGDEASFTRELLALTSDRSKLVELGYQARANASKYSWDAVVETANELYRGALTG